MSRNVQVSLTAACEHIEAIGRDVMRPMCFRVIAETEAAKAFVADKKNHPMRFRYRGTINDLFDKLKSRNEKGFAVYYVLNRTDGKGTKLANFTHALAVPLDLDGAPLPKKWRGGLRPHLIIESSPGKYQCIFRIEPTKDLKAAKVVAQRVALTYGGDPKVCDTPRVLRLAGFAHQKGKPFVSRIIETNDFQMPYKLAQFDDVLKRLPPPKPRAEGPSGAGKMDRAAAELLLDALDPADVVPTNTEWLDFAMGAKVACADADAEDYVLGWFARDGDHDPDAAEARWDTFATDREDGIGVGTFIKFLQDHGVSGDAIHSVFGDNIDAADDFDDDVGAPDDGDEDWSFNNPDADDDDDVTEPMNVMSRGLKVNKQAVAADTFKNSMGALIGTGLRPAYNEMSKNVEFIGDVPWDVARYGRILNDSVLSAVRLYLIGRYQGNDFDPSLKHLNEALDSLAYANRFNPVRDYLDSLKWDGTPRVEKLFGKYFNCGVDPYTRGVSKAFMIGAVARIRRPGCKFDTMVVLKGPQGWNKSTALRKLFGDDYYSDANLGPLTNKDASMKLRGLWVYEFSEIESLRKHEVNVLKSFISLQTDRQRDPYERRVSDVPRSTVFAATVNEGGYLGDATGGRRFWPLELQARIDVAALEADRDQLWAEAAQMESNGESRVLPQKLWDVAGERQQAETMGDPWEDDLRAYLDRRAALADGETINDDDDPDGFDEGPPPPADKVHASELFDMLGIPARDRNRATGGRLRSVMESRLGWKHKASLRIGDDVKAGYDRPL